MESKKIMIDLCCGLGGWTEGGLAVDFRCIGYDIEKYDYPGELNIQDILTLDGKPWRNQVRLLVASPPCQEFSRWQMPWTRKTAVEPDLSLVEACFRLRDEINPDYFLLENVRAAQGWLGKADGHAGPFYFWGDACLIPHLRNMGKVKESYSGKRPELRAKIPFEISYRVAIAAC